MSVSKEGHKALLLDFMKLFFLVIFITGVSFLYLLQRVRGRSLNMDIVKLRNERAKILKGINQLDYRIERLKAPDRIIPLAEKMLGMKK